MKKALIALSAMLAVSTAMVVITAEDGNTPHLLGMRKCTWGPSYWCENIKTAAGCNATKHCIKTTWTKMEVPEDNDSVCTVCKDMVQQARDQLESNQTLQDLKDVFEGSCKLIHVKPIIKECITLVDQFIPELVETLASQMNPSVVCSVAGLCNSAHIDKLLLEYGDSESKMEKLKSRSLENDELEPDECSKCYTVAAHMEHKLSNTPPDQMLQQMLNLCGDLGTFTDACSATILTYFDTIYAHLKQNFNVQNVCHLSGQCSAKFHKHEGDNDTAPKVEIRPLSSVGVVDVGDDLPCKLCEQLVGHLRDLLVANTTEAEFQQVLDGLCKQTKSFSTECRAIVDEYYPQIYEYLTKGLDSNLICEMSGICPKRGKLLQNTAIWPLIPENAANIGIRIFKEGKKNAEIEKGEELTKSEVEAMQLPIERTVPFPTLQPVGGKQSCALCEYLLHYVQESLTNPVTEDKVKKVLGNLCNKLPESLTGECSEFVDTYGDAVVAILAQEIDPSQVCPMLRMCPSEELLKLLQTVPNEFVLETEKVENKPSCPLCLLAVTQIYNVIKDDKTEANIEKELDKLCTHLPSSLTDECKDLVKGYSKELVELLIADLTPQEVCVYIKLCDATKNPGPKDMFVTDKDGEILTNEIPEYSPASPQKPVKLDTDVGCVICEFAMQYVDKALSNKNEKDRIEKIVHGVCNHLPKTISKECNDFVDKYADVVIEILSQDVSPKQVCSMMGLCKDTKIMKENIAECSLCRAIISAIDTYLNDPKFDYDIVETVSEVCKRLPATVQPKCEKLIKVYGPSIINILKSNTDNENICKKIALCPSNDIAIKGSRERRSYQRDRIHRCTWGAAYWCSSNETAVECRALEHCQENVWKAEFAPNKQIALAEVKREV